MANVIIGGCSFSNAFSDAFETCLDGVSANFEINTPVIAISPNINITEVSATFDINNPELTITSVIDAIEVSATFNINEPDIRLESTVLPDEIPASFTVEIPIIIAIIETDPITVSATFTLPVADINIASKIDVPGHDLYFVVCPPTVTVDGNNIFNCSGPLPNSFWDKETACHDGEKEMFDTLQMDAWNSFGIDMTYYVVDYNTDYDKIYGEDRDRLIERKFEFKGYIQTYPEEKQMYSNFGIEGMDNFAFWVNIKHLDFVSTFDEQGSTCFPPYEAREGDIIKFDYSELYYEIIYVVKSANQFLQTQHSYTIIVKVFRDLHMSLSPSVSSDAISAFTDKPEDIFDISDEINKEKIEFLFDASAANEPPLNPDPYPPVNDDPFGGW